MNSALAAFVGNGPSLATIPSPDRGVYELDLGFVTVPLRMYALCIIAGIVVAIWWGERRWQQRGGAKGTIIDIAVFAVPFGLIGGRLYHVLTDWYRYFGEGKNPLNALKIWEGGLGIWGAIAVGGVGALIACRRKGIPLPALADAIAPGIVTAQAIGRLGNYFNQELYGATTDLPWGLEVYQRFSPDNPLIPDDLGGVAIGHVPLDVSPVHPTFLYELLWNLGIALLIVWLDRKFRLGHGRVFALYVAGYTLGRCWIEMMRTDDATMVLGLRINVWTSILVFLGAVAYFVLARKRGPREEPELLRGKDFVPDGDDGDKAGARTGAGGAAADGTAEGGRDKPAASADRDAVDGDPAADAAEPGESAAGSERDE